MWCGIERHASLVTVAERLTRALGVAEHVRFVHGDAFAVDWSPFDAIYLYNPFELDPFAADSTRRADDHRAQIALAEDRLAGLRAGARVVTFHGFGGVMPASYELVYQERMPLLGCDLVLWIQRARARRTTWVS
jgi:hypothetical protein